LPGRTLAAYALVLLAMAAHAAPGQPEIRVEGSASSVHLNARDATRTDILAALAKRFDLRFRGAAGDGRITADFDGPLRRVIASVLNGYDYVIRTHDDGLEVILLETSSPKAVLAPVYAPPTYPTARLRRDE